RQRPVAASRRNRAPAEQDAVTVGAHRTDDDLRVFIADEAAAVADQPRPIVAVRYAAREMIRNMGMIGHAADNAVSRAPAPRSFRNLRSNSASGLSSSARLPSSAPDSHGGLPLRESERPVPRPTRRDPND